MHCDGRLRAVNSRLLGTRASPLALRAPAVPAVAAFVRSLCRSRSHRPLSLHSSPRPRAVMLSTAVRLRSAALAQRTMQHAIAAIGATRGVAAVSAASAALCRSSTATTPLSRLAVRTPLSARGDHRTIHCSAHAKNEEPAPSATPEEFAVSTANDAATPAPRAARRRSAVAAAAAAASAPPVPSATPTPLPRAHPTFTDLHVSSTLVHRLAAGSIHRPTTIQAAVIPHLSRRPWNAPSYPDCIVQEMTGQGKTLAYLLPMLSNIDRSVPRIQAMIIVPTRELATQVSRVLHELAAPSSARSLPLAVATLVGDAPNPSMLSGLVKAAAHAAPQIRADEHVDLSTLLIPQHHPHVIVGTPAVVHAIWVSQALSDVRSVLPLTHLKYLVFDEIDNLLNAASSRNLLVPLIALRHHARALQLDHVLKEQAMLDATREQRKQRKQVLDAQFAQEEEEARRKERTTLKEGEEFMDDDPVVAEGEAESDAADHPQQPLQLQQQEAPAEDASEANPAAPADVTSALDSTAAPASDSSPISNTPALFTTSFPRNQVVLVSATITPAVHHFAARFLSPSRAFLTPESVALGLGGQKEEKERRKRVGTAGAEVVGSSPSASALVAAAPAALSSSSSSAPVHRLPPHIRHYYLLVNRPYDRLNSLQQLLQAIKFQFERWKTSELGLGKTPSPKLTAAQAKPPSASWLAKQLGPQRAPSAGGALPSNLSPTQRYLAGGVSSMGVGARGHFLQASLVFLNHRASIPSLVNPLSQQGFNLGVVSEHSSRAERREALNLAKGVELVLATDVMARGMDLKSLTHVVNYDVPSSPNLYLHRAGRVGRLGAVHAKLGTVVTLVDLQRDPKALEHLAKICATLNGQQSHASKAGKTAGPSMQFQRIYVKKGKIFEDVDETHVVRADQVPKLEAFVTRDEKTAAAAAGDAASAASSSSGGKKERSVRVQATHSDHTAAKRRKALAVQDAASDSESTPDAALLPVDPDERQSAARELSTVFGSEQLDSLKLAELELAAVSAPTKKRQQRSQRPRDTQNQAAATRSRSR